MHCRTCHQPKCVEDFPLRGGGIRRTECKKCFGIRQRKHYRNNKAAYIVRNVRRTKEERKRQAQVVFDLKDGKQCVDCGVPYRAWQLQFDHPPGAHKIGDVASIVGNVSETRLMSEIAKCDLVCANCHADRTYKRRKGL